MKRFLKSWLSRSISEQTAHDKIVFLNILFSGAILASCKANSLEGGNGAKLGGGNGIRTTRPVNSTLGEARKDLPPGILYVPPEAENAGGNPSPTNSVGATGVDSSSAGDAVIQHPLSRGANLDLAIEPGVREVKDGQQITNTLKLYFALDVTGSMQVNINGIKNNIAELVKKLSSKSLNVRIGLVAFRDNISYALPATKDISVFIAELSKMNASGGGNAWEASLLAISEATKLMNQDYQPGDSNAILVVSDNPGHFGNARDCRIDQLVSTLNSYSPQFQQSLRIYGSLAADGSSAASHLPCPGLGYARQQFEAILENSITAVPKLKRGGMIDYPLEANSMLDQLVRLIERTIPAQREICLSKSLDINHGGSLINSWTTPSLVDSYGQFVVGDAVIWKNALSAAQAAPLFGQTLTGDLKRCCISEDKAVLGDFAGCREIHRNLEFVLQK